MCYDYFSRRWKGDYLNDTAENTFYDAYRSALMKDGINQKSVLFSAPVKKFNRHGKVIRNLPLTRLNMLFSPTLPVIRFCHHYRNPKQP